MQNRFVARVFVGLIFLFPVLASGLPFLWGHSGFSLLRSLAPVLAVETFLVAGSVLAFGQRRRLVAELEIARSQRMTDSAPRTAPSLHGSIVTINRPIYGNVKH